VSGAASNGLGGFAAGSRTAFTYDGVGQLKTVRLPTGETVTYEYDDAHRLTDIIDGLGNRVHYGLDLAGHRTLIEVRDSTGVAVQRESRDYDSLGRLAELLSGAGVKSTYDYDAEGKLEEMTVGEGADAATTRLSYDALDRLKTVTDALAGLTTSGYDGQDVITQVTTPNGAATGFTVNGFGETRVETSPDRGTLTRSYDEAGNLESETDARGVTTAYDYDALNRLIAIDRPGALDDVTYTWDAAPGCGFGIGRLCAITDASGTHGFSYDARGNRLEHVHTVMGVSYRHVQGFDASDRVIEERLPTGLEVSYRFDAAGRPSGVWRRVAGQDFPLLTLTTRDAAGQVREAVFGNGVTLARALDLAGRLEDQLSDDTATLVRGGPGGGGFIDGVTVLPEARTVPLPWLVLPIALALLIRLGLMASGRRATDTPLILIALTDGVLIAALLSPRTVEAPVDLP
jgi:YD repeat-containing protein